jgi:anaerobic dimethyl sulfoxide reductase subunit C (anchor subunit)
MSNNNWPLMVFTLAVQFSVGVIVLYDLFLVFPVFRKKEKLPIRFSMVLLVALIAAFCGALFSFLHLGNPSKALNTLANLDRSWLSREVLFVLIYSGLLFLVTILQFRFPSAIRSYKWLLDLTAITGLILVSVMSRIYQLPSMPAWNSIFTPIGFYLAVFLSGSSLLLLFQLNSGSWACQKGLTAMIIAIPIIQLGLLPVHMSWLGEAGESARLSQNLLLNQYLPAFFFRLGFQILTAAFGFWAFFSISSDTLKKRNLFIPALLAFITMALTLIFDRFLFYQQMVPIGNL